MNETPQIETQPRRRLREINKRFIPWAKRGEPMLPEQAAWWAERRQLVATELVAIGRAELARQEGEGAA